MKPTRKQAARPAAETGEGAPGSELAAARQAVRDLIEAAPCGAHLYELQPDDRLVLVGANRAAERALRLDHAPLVGRTAEEAFPSLVGTPIPDGYRRVARTGEPFEADLALCGDERLSGTFEVSAVRVGMNRVVALFRDVTECRRAEAALRESEARCWDLSQELHALVDAIPDGVALLSPDLRFVWANERTAVALSVRREDLAGRSCHEVWHGRDTPCPQCAVQESFRTGEPASGHVVDERGRVWEHRAVPVRDEAGGVTGVLQLSRDFTKGRRAEVERERLLAEVRRHAAELEATIASIPDGVMIYGPQGEIVRMNGAAEGMLGYATEERERSIAFRHETLRVESADRRRLPLSASPPVRALRGETVQGQILILHPRSERELWVSASAAPIFDARGELAGAVLVLTDISALQTLEEQREDFLRAVSHDLRTPLVSVGGFAQLLQRHLQQSGARAEIEYADIILASTRRMQAMISELVDAVRLESRQARPAREPVGLGAFVEGVLHRLGEGLETARVASEIPLTLPPVLADPSGLERIIQNLVGNALKYSPPGTPVTLAAEPEAEAVRVSVFDRGPGIPAADLPRIFERYYRAEGTRRAEGLGLGLYITRMLVEAQGGRIWVERREGGGSVFSFTLPLA